METAEVLTPKNRVKARKKFFTGKILGLRIGKDDIKFSFQSSYVASEW